MLQQCKHGEGHPIKVQPTKLLTACFTVFIINSVNIAIANEIDILNEANQLISNNQNLQAMQLLESHMDENAGIPAYDYLLGKTSLALKKPNLAIFALERVSLSTPDFHNARFLLGKAYLEAGEFEQASREFSLIIRSSNKEDLREASKTYLQTIEDKKKAAKQSTNLMLTLGLGIDSNANNATDNDIFGSIKLSDESVSQSSSISRYTLSGSYNYLINRRYQIHSNAQIFKYEYADALFVNTNGAAASLGVSHRTKTNNQYAGIDYQHIEVNKKLNSKQLATSASHYQKISDHFAIRGTIRGAQVKHHEKYKIADYRTVNGGLQLHHFATTKEKESVTTSFSLLAGKERPLLATSQYGRKYATVLLGIQFGSQNRKMNLSTNLSYTYSDYDRDFASFTNNQVISTQRTDKTVSFSTKLNLKIHKKWTLSPEFRVMRTRSPIALYEYGKMQLMLLVSRQLAT